MNKGILAIAILSISTTVQAQSAGVSASALDQQIVHKLTHPQSVAVMEGINIGSYALNEGTASSVLPKPATKVANAPLGGKT